MKNPFRFTAQALCALLDKAIGRMTDSPEERIHKELVRKRDEIFEAAAICSELRRNIMEDVLAIWGNDELKPFLTQKIERALNPDAAEEAMAVCQAILSSASADDAFELANRSVMQALNNYMQELQSYLHREPRNRQELKNYNEESKTRAEGLVTEPPLRAAALDYYEKSKAYNAALLDMAHIITHNIPEGLSVVTHARAIITGLSNPTASKKFLRLAAHRHTL